MNVHPPVKCPVCGSPAPLVAGRAVTRLYRCPKCTSQLLLPAGVAAPLSAQAAQPPRVGKRKGRA